MAAVATRYARALVDVVTGPSAPVAPDAVRAELRSFLDAFQASEELRNVLASPMVPAHRKRALVERLAQPLSLSRTSQNFLFVLIDHRRAGLLGEILKTFETMLDERQGIVRAGVTTAKELAPEEQRMLEESLRKLTGRQVRPEYSVDPALIGGAVTRIGSTVYDGSVREQLRQIRARLSG